jgi:TRAP-type C4-dicarboxylate transport system permease small subunit
VTIAAAIFLIAVGAILRYATNINVEGISIDTVGLILMIAGAAGLVLSFIQESVSSRRRDRRELEARERIAAEQRAAQQRQDPGAPPPPPPRY